MPQDATTGHIPFFKRIAFRLARYGIVFALLLGFAIGVLQIILDLSEQDRELDKIVGQILRVSEYSASQAAHRLDRRLAVQVVDGLLEYDFITDARIVDDFGDVLAARDKPHRDSATDWITGWISEPYLNYDIGLTQPGETTVFGRLEVTVDHDAALSAFFGRSLFNLGFGIVRSLLLATLLLAVFHIALTRPLTAFIHRLERVDPRKPEPIGAPFHDSHKDDEFGHLADTTNSVLRASHEYLQRLHAAESALKDSEQRFHDFADASSDWYWEMGPDLRFTYMSEGGFQISGLPHDEIIGRTRRELVKYLDDEEKWNQHFRDLDLRKPFRNFRYRFVRPNRKEHYWSISGIPIYDENGAFKGYRGTGTDVTAEMTALAKAEEAEDRLRQAQKMEVVGQLTGGIAHDFNNLLAVVIGNLELLQEGMDPDDERARFIGDAIAAATRGSNLTQRLLAFSRRQALQPVPTDLNKLVGGMTELLRRTLGETIEIETVISGGLWPCEVDHVQLENALLNLAINARDAMTDGGKLTIETANARLDDEYAASQLELAPGQYVMLAVTDTGTGMTPDEAEKAFEPFFTTKEVGKGSGLGLSMVYGFAKQSGGLAKIYTEPGEGTTVKLYLPRSMQPVESPAANRPGDNESAESQEATIMVVEDDAEVRALTVTMLKSMGYAVLEAGRGDGAVDILRRDGPADLLLTDVVLPGTLNGRDLVDKVTEFFPDIGVLYMSGYTENSIIHHDRLDEGVVLLQKPFRRADLAQKVKMVLAETRTRRDSNQKKTRPDKPGG